ncbi:predicted protein [Arabidopsis lyrata subsp. lyrata]|uniref:Predicted protein n=1 Tax=Arabidopsis lyrata subsp. lyrata TaxID=81972 RepID=D7KZ38_ARALL|nr:predicted protein [Arabidopsis lyrata subsp. lyrata]
MQPGHGPSAKSLFTAQPDHDHAAIKQGHRTLGARPCGHCSPKSFIQKAEFCRRKP